MPNPEPQVASPNLKGLPPGPPGHFLIGSFPLGTSDPLQLLAEWARTYGDIFYYRAFTSPVYFLNHPDLIASVLVTHCRDFIKGRGLQVNGRLFGKGLLTSEGDLWLRERRLCQPAFHSEQVQRYGELMVEYAERMLASWQPGESRDLCTDMRRLTLEIVAKTLFNVEIGDWVDGVVEAAEPIMALNTRGRILVPFMRYLPTPLNLRYRRAVRSLERIVRTIIERRAQCRGDGEDLLSMLLRAHDQDGQPLSFRQVRDEIMTLILAGHETTALALSWTFYLLASNPSVEAKLMAEITGVLGQEPPRAHDLARLPYAERVVRESMRLYPPAFAVARMAIRDCEIGGYRVPRQASVVMSQWVTHRDPRFFHNPEHFDPDRWSEEFVERLPRFAYFPFGGGPRVCIGSSFARMEATLLVTSILQRFHFSLDPACEVTPVTSITLRPKNGIRVVLEPRCRITRSEPGA
ncbi:MAG TPA: cytochrome P450 [Terriglobia bacterium]|nr:cytochrome P450 [Terriglobia bacterium]